MSHTTHNTQIIRIQDNETNKKIQTNRMLPNVNLKHTCSGSHKFGAKLTPINKHISTTCYLIFACSIMYILLVKKN